MIFTWANQPLRKSDHGQQHFGFQFCWGVRINALDSGMGKRTEAMNRSDARREMKKTIKKDMAFPCSVPRAPRDPRQKQLTQLLAGLNYLRAPVVSSLRRGWCGIMVWDWL